MTSFELDGIEYIQRGNLVFKVNPRCPSRRYGPVGALLFVAGTALQAYGTYQEGKQAVKVGKLQQEQYNAEAEATRRAGQVESREKRKEGYRLTASQIAQMGANGGVITGSNLKILANTAKEVEADALMIQRNYDTKAMQLENEGKIAAYQGRAYRQAARIRMLADMGRNLGSLYLATGNFSPKTQTPKVSYSERMATLRKY